MLLFLASLAFMLLKYIVITDSGFDYVCGDAGRAIVGGPNFRNMIMLHSQDNMQGYYVLFDEVNTKASFTVDVHVLTHPNSRVVSTVHENEEYESSIDTLNITSNFDKLLAKSSIKSLVLEKRCG